RHARRVHACWPPAVGADRREGGVDSVQDAVERRSIQHVRAHSLQAIAGGINRRRVAGNGSDLVVLAQRLLNQCSARWAGATEDSEVHADLHPYGWRAPTLTSRIVGTPSVLSVR